MFEKLVSFTKKVADLPDQPTLDAANLKAQFDAAPDEVRVYLNNLIDALKSNTTGDSGAKNIGATTISGLDGSDVQTILESLKNYSYAKSETYSKNEIDNKQPVVGQSSTITLNTGNSTNFSFTYPAGRFTNPPNLKYSVLNSDVEGKYFTADSITANSKDGGTITLKNKGSNTQYYIIYWEAK